MLFGVDIPAAGRRLDPAAAAQEAQALGFDFVSTNDHVLGDGPRYEGWTHLAWLAAATRRIRVVSRVLGMPYRNPVLVAKMAETLDALSGGRLILGLGAGSGEDEYRAMGLPDATPAERLTDLEDAVVVLEALWKVGAADYHGRTLRVINARISPPATRAIPIWLGTVGPRGLDLVGKRAHGWIPSMPYVTATNARSKIERIRNAAERAGRDPEQLDLVLNLEISFDPKFPADVVGTPQEITGELTRLSNLGFTGFNVQPVGEDRSSDLERLMRDVIAQLR